MTSGGAGGAGPSTANGMSEDAAGGGAFGAGLAGLCAAAADPARSMPASHPHTAGACAMRFMLLSISHAPARARITESPRRVRRAALSVFNLLVDRLPKLR